MEIGHSIRRNIEETTKDYRDLIATVRKFELTTKVVKRVLVTTCGFSEQWAMQVVRVAAAPELVYKDYHTGALTFRAALEKARVQGGHQRGGKKVQRSKLLALAHKVGDFVASEDTDVVAVLSGVVDESLQTWTVSKKIGKFTITIEKRS